MRCRFQAGRKKDTFVQGRGGFHTGCRDVFNAAFIRAYLSGWSAEDAGRFANRAAARKSMALGVINGASYIDEVDWNEGRAVSE